jgi:hypothetical protein
MTVVNQQTGERFNITAFDIRAGLVFVDYQTDRFSSIEKRSYVFNELTNSTKIDILNLVWEDMKVSNEWSSCVKEVEFSDWPSYSEKEGDERYLRKYRIYVNYAQIAKITVHAPGFIDKVHNSTMIKELYDSKGYYIYATRLDSGDPFALVNFFGVTTFDINPHLTDVEPIDFYPTEAQLAYIASLNTAPEIQPENGTE